MKKVFAIFGIISLFACEKSQPIQPYPCLDGSCDAQFFIDTLVSPGSYFDSTDGYWRVKYSGLTYFTIQGQLDELDPQYVINKVPLIETQFDSDYWVVFDTLQWTSPMYSVLSWFSDQSYTQPIAVGNLTYTLEDIANVHPPLNIVGYQIPKFFCWDCPYAPTLLGTYSKHTYQPRKQIFLDDEMVGDTATIFMKVLFNNDIGFREVREQQISVIFE